MAIQNRVFLLPSILIESIEENAPALPADPPSSHWWTGLLKLFSLVHLYWDLLSHIPLDIFLSAVFPNRAEPRRFKSMDDRLDLHPTLPLLVVSTKSSPDVRFYNTKTSEHMWTVRIKMPTDTRDGQARMKSSITCLEISRGNHLAVRLSDGTVHLIEHDFATMTKSPSTPETAKEPNSEHVMLLPLGGSRVNADFLGSVTNLAFSPRTGGMGGNDIWLAIATEKAGIWIWSLRTREAIRAVSTTGINEGCLHWVSMLEPQPARRKRQRGFFKGVDDTEELMDRSFAPSAGRARYLIKPDKDTHLEESLMVFGTKTGKIQIQRLRHFPGTMVRGTSIELSPTALAQSYQQFTHRFGPASGEITHLVVQSPEITSSEAELTILLASKNDAESSVPAHQFSISLPLEQPLETWSSWAPALSAGILRSLVNLFLAGTNHRWMSHRKGSFEGAYQLALGAPTASQHTALTFAATRLLLTTTHVKEVRRFHPAARAECILRSHSACARSLATKLLIPPLPPVPGHKHHYTTMMARARTPQNHPRPVATRAYACGRVAWGQQKRGEAIGGFLFQPVRAWRWACSGSGFEGKKKRGENYIRAVGV